MLTPEYLDICAEDLVELYRQLDESVVQIVAARIAKTDFVSDSSQWQIEKLQQAGMTYDEVIAAIAQYTQKSEDEVKEMFKEAGVKTIAADNEIFQKAGLATTGIKQSASMTQLLRVGLAKTNGKLRNLTLTTALTAQTAYLNACDLAYMQIASGTLSMPEAVRYAVKAAAKQGTRVNYPSGHSDQLDVAVRRSAVTGVNQTCAEIQLANTENMGCNLVEVTAHIGARPTHAEWQGGVYMLNGSSRQYRNLEEATGYGTGDGLCGWNCRHNFFPFFEGIDLHAYRDDYLEKLKNDGYYEAEQKQRYYERKVRETRRELSGYDSAIKAAQTPEQAAALKQEFDRASVKLKKQETALKDWCKSNNLVYDRNRVQTYYGKGTTQGFNRSVSQKAVWANRKSLQNAANGGKISLDSGTVYHTVTKGSIARVPRLHVSSDEGFNMRYQKAGRELLRVVMESGTKPGTEFSVVYNRDMNRIGQYRRGDVGHVPIDNPDELYHALHNHGSGKTLSFTDIRNMLNKDSQMSITAVGNNGNVYGLFMTADGDRDGYSNYLANKAEEIIYSANGVKFSLNTVEQIAKARSKMPQLTEQQKTELENAIVKSTEEILKESEKYGFQYFK